jgi:DNA-binding NarL/FixJ family response regulator
MKKATPAGILEITARLPVGGACLPIMDNMDYITVRSTMHASKPTVGAETIRILIVEDQPGVRKGLRMRLDAEADLTVVGEAVDCESALDLAVSLCPDIVLMDVAMPRVDGIATARALHRIDPRTSIIILSFQDDPLTRARAADAGAAAFVAKSMPTDTLLVTIRQVAQTRRAPAKGG